MFPSIIVDVLGGTGVPGPGPCAPRVPMRGRRDLHACGRVARQARDVRGCRVGSSGFWGVPTVHDESAQWRPRGGAVRSLFEAGRLQKLRSAVVESLGMQENSDVREGEKREARGP